MNLTNSIKWSWILVLFVAILFIQTVQAGPIPYSVYSRYTTLAIRFEQDAAAEKFHQAIAVFYQQQQGKNSARQLLAGNLYLQVLLQQKQYQQGYEVVNHLLKQELALPQKLSFQQLAAQLMLSQRSELASGNATSKNNTASNNKVTSENRDKQSWQKAAVHLQAWFKLVNEVALEVEANKRSDKEVQVLNIGDKQQAINAALLAQAYYQLSEIKQALPWAQLSYKLKPKNEAYLKLLIALYERAEAYKALNQLLAIAVVDFPQGKDYWSRWAYSYLKIEEPEKALSTLAIARSQTQLSQQGYTILASLYLSQQQPRLAAKILLEGKEKGLLIANKQYYKRLSNAWLMARDRQQVLAVYAQAEAAGIVLAKSQQRRAQLSYIEGEWSVAEAAYQKLLNSTQSGMADTREKWRFMLAMTQVQQDKHSLAKTNLERLNTAKYKAYAKSWLAQIEG